MPLARALMNGPIGPTQSGTFWPFKKPHPLEILHNIAPYRFYLKTRGIQIVIRTKQACTALRPPSVAARSRTFRARGPRCKIARRRWLAMRPRYNFDGRRSPPGEGIITNEGTRTKEFSYRSQNSLRISKKVSTENIWSQQCCPDYRMNLLICRARRSGWLSRRDGALGARSEGAWRSWRKKVVAVLDGNEERGVASRPKTIEGKGRARAAYRFLIAIAVWLQSYRSARANSKQAWSETGLSSHRPEGGKRSRRVTVEGGPSV